MLATLQWLKNLNPKKIDNQCIDIFNIFIKSRNKYLCLSIYDVTTKLTFIQTNILV